MFQKGCQDLVLRFANARYQVLATFSVGPLWGQKRVGYFFRCGWEYVVSITLKCIFVKKRRKYVFGPSSTCLPANFHLHSHTTRRAGEGSSKYLFTNIMQIASAILFFGVNGTNHLFWSALLQSTRLLTGITNTHCRVF